MSSLPTTMASLPAFFWVFFFLASTSVTRNTIRVPSGDHRGALTPFFDRVSCLASPPSGRINQTWFLSPRSEVNATRDPSDDQFGPPSPLGPFVSWDGAPPREDTIHMCDLCVLVVASMTALETEKATELPSGEISTFPSVLSAMTSSGQKAFRFVNIRLCSFSRVVQGLRVSAFPAKAPERFALPEAG